MTIPERCLRCDWWNHNGHKCDRIFKARVRIGPDAGEVLFESQPGVIPKYLEEDLGAYLVTILGDIVDKWGGWGEIQRIKKGGKPCPSEQPSVAIKEYGATLKLVRPVQDPKPLENKDGHGLFKSDISLL